MKKIFMYEGNLDYNGQASPTAKNDSANLFLLNLSLKKPENSKFIETLSLLGECNG